MKGQSPNIYKRPEKKLGQLSSLKFFTVDPYLEVIFFIGHSESAQFSTSSTYVYRQSCFVHSLLIVQTERWPENQLKNQRKSPENLWKSVLSTFPESFAYALIHFSVSWCLVGYLHSKNWIFIYFSSLSMVAIFFLWILQTSWLV